MTGMEMKSVVALVTGANRGIGKALVQALHQAGAKKIYAGARNPDSLRDLVASGRDRIVPIKLDVTNAADVAAAALAAGDVNVLINNAGVAGMVTDLKSLSIDTARNEMEVNYFGLLSTTLSFAPVLARNGGGMVVNIASIVSFLSLPMFATYCASKHAAHSLSQSLRGLLAGQNTRVMTVHPGPIDTDMAAGIDMEKASPESVAQRVLNGIRQGHDLITADPYADEAFANWRRDPIEAQRAAVAEPVEA